jgi:preprotein translocase subunit SecE
MVPGFRSGFLMKIQEYFFKFSAFVSDVGLELKKSAWPTRSELIGSTVVIVLSVLVLGAFVGASDYVLVKLVRWFLAG